MKRQYISPELTVYVTEADTDILDFSQNEKDIDVSELLD